MSDINERESIREQLNDMKETREAESRFKSAGDSSNDNTDKSKSRFENADELKNDKTDEPESRFEDADESEDEEQNDYIKIGGDTVNPESPYVTTRETAENSGYIEGDKVIDSEKAQEELALPDSNPADTVHDMEHISGKTHDLYVSDVAPNFGHDGGGEQTIAIRKEGEPLKDSESETYKFEHKPGDEGVEDNRKELSDFSDNDWESAYTENEMKKSVDEHNEKYPDNNLDFYEISNSGENFKRADGSSALEDYQTENKEKLENMMNNETSENKSFEEEEKEDDFKIETDGNSINIDTDRETITELKEQGYELDMEVEEPDDKEKKSDTPKTEIEEEAEIEEEEEIEEEAEIEEEEEIEEEAEIEEEEEAEKKEQDTRQKLSDIHRTDKPKDNVGFGAR